MSEVLLYPSDYLFSLHQNESHGSIFLFRVPKHCLRKSSFFFQKAIYFIKPKLGMGEETEGTQEWQVKMSWWSAVSSREAHSTLIFVLERGFQ